MLTNAWQIQNAYVEMEQRGLDQTAVTIARLIALVLADQMSDLLKEEVSRRS